MSSPSRVGRENNDNGKIRGTPPKDPQSPSPTMKQVIHAPAPSSPLNFDFSGVIKSQDLLELAACPCCKQTIDARKHQTLMEPRVISESHQPPTGLVAVGSTTNGSEDDIVDSSDEEDTLPNGVAEGLHYTPRRILVEGWLHKKGTGNDWLGSRSWKPRWARLVVSNENAF